MDRKHDSLLKCLQTQWFLNQPTYAVFSHDIGDARDPNPIYHLFSKRQFRKVQEQDPTIVLDHVDRIKDHSLWRVVIYWGWREYLHGWRSQFAKPLPCGCTEWRGKRYIYCSG